MKQLRPPALLAGSAIIILAIILPIILTSNHPKPTGSSVKPATLLTALWQDYQHRYIHGGQTVDPASGDTTSEGQSYTMLRAVWSGDKSTFDAAWNWTSQHLKRSDGLFSWKWGQRPDGTAGILTNEGGENTASDADTDIALSLLMAGSKWRSSHYTSAAKSIIPAIWEQEVMEAGGQPYLTADELEKNSPAPVINPSYFAPYAYRLFAGVDKSHPWQQLATNSYQVMHDASQQQLDSSSSDNLPPDWIKLNRQTGQLMADTTPSHDTNFGYDAFRAVWRTALDYQWNHAADAENTLASFSRLTDFWTHDHKLYAIYHHDGTPAAGYSSYAMYGGTLGYYQFMHPALAEAIYSTKLAPLYSTKEGKLTQTLNYYDNNWVWFGLALYTHQLPQLVQSGASL